MHLTQSQMLERIECNRGPIFKANNAYIFMNFIFSMIFDWK